MTTSVNQIGSVCVDDVNITAFASSTSFLSDDGFVAREPLLQTQAIEECANFDERKFKLGVFTNAQELNASRMMISESEELFPFDPLTTLHRFGFYIGLEAKNGQPEEGSTNAFSFVDDSINPDVLEFYHVESGEFPWDEGEPNNGRQPLAQQPCGQMFFTLNEVGEFVDGLIDDIQCESSSGFICTGPCFEANIGNEDGLDPEEDNTGGTEILMFGYLLGMISCAFAFLVTIIAFFERKFRLRKVKSLQLFLADYNLSFEFDYELL